MLMQDMGPPAVRCCARHPAMTACFAAAGCGGSQCSTRGGGGAREVAASLLPVRVVMASRLKRNGLFTRTAASCCTTRASPVRAAMEETIAAGQDGLGRPRRSSRPHTRNGCAQRCKVAQRQDNSAGYAWGGVCGRKVGRRPLKSSTWFWVGCAQFPRAGPPVQGQRCAPTLQGRCVRSGRPEAAHS
jgi:hypothetical protein